MARKPTTFSQIDALRERFYHVLPGKESLLKVINEAEIPEHVYDSNAIENSTLTLEETEKILLEVDLERFVSAREIHEAKNLARVSTYIESHAAGEILSTDLMLRLHQMLMGNINEDIAGRFRQKGEYVRVGTYIAPDPEKVSSLLSKLLTTHSTSKKEHIITQIAQFHLEFEHIHPFNDGNGRIGRVLNNYILLREGYVPINIAFATRERYYQAFKDYDESQGTKAMEEIVGRSLVESYHKRLAYLEGKNIITLKKFASTSKSSYSNLLNKAERQTIPAFREKGVWKIGADFQQGEEK